LQDLAGRTAFVTGGANGIGLGLVRALLAEGCKVALADIRQDAIDAALATLDNQDVMGVQLDVASRDGFAAAADRVEADLGPVSLVFNNAGVNLFQTIDDSSYDDWDWVLGVNLHGVVNGVMTFIPRMKARGGGGHIVNTASMAAFLCGPQPGIYNTAKFAVRGMSESLRYSLAPHGIGVSVLCPGLTKTRILEQSPSRPKAGLAATREGDPDELFNTLDGAMDPLEVGEAVMRGIRANAPYILPHGEFREEVQGLFDEILTAFPENQEVDPRRLAFEEGRRRITEQLKAAMPRGKP